MISAEKLHFACYLAISLLSLPLLAECHAIRLMGPSRCSGRVEVYYNNMWGTVCDDDWSLANAGVVCRELHCGTAVEAKGSAFFGQGGGDIWLDDVQCTGQEPSITQCTHNAFGTHNCGHGEDAGVICSERRTLRLVGPSPCSGRVEVFYNNRWGTVCDDNWSLSTAGVVCRELECGTAVEVKASAFFGQGEGNIWLDDVQCTGQEPSIFQCEHKPFGTNNCGHGEDVGVICSG